MTADDWQTAGSITGYVLLGLLVTWKAHQAEKKAGKSAVLAEKSAEHAEQAEIYAKPTGNGFANEVRASLARIEERQQRSDQVLFDHITAHANADIMRSGRESSSNPNTP